MLSIYFFVIGLLVIYFVCIVDCGEIVEDGWFCIEDGFIVVCGMGLEWMVVDEVVDVIGVVGVGVLFMFGFVDIYGYGGVGVVFDDGVEVICVGCVLYCEYGIICVVILFVIVFVDVFVESVVVIVDLIEMDVDVLGFYFEGFFFDFGYYGVYEFLLLWYLMVDDVVWLLVVGCGMIWQIMIVFELLGGFDVIWQIVVVGIVVVVGYIDVDVVMVVVVFEVGVLIFMYVFNVMLGIYYWVFGFVFVVVVDYWVVLEVIVDNVYFDLYVIKFVFDFVFGCVVLIMDVMVVVGSVDGYYDFGVVSVMVEDGVVWVDDIGLIVGLIFIQDVVL